MDWLNEPHDWSWRDNRLEVVADGDTDFWRETHYRFIHDNGHFFYRRVEGDFSSSVRFSGDYLHLYDQAGMMIRLDERNWLKAGIEYTDGRQNLSVVNTRDFSDWSVLPLEASPEWVWLRLSRRCDAVKVEWSVDGATYFMLRLAYLAPSAQAMVGLLCCSPLRSGFAARFEEFSIVPVVEPFLH